MTVIVTRGKNFVYVIILFVMYISGHIHMCNADEVVYPQSSGVIDVVKEYDVDTTGTVDVTDKIQQALTDYPSTRTIYLRNGTYKVSNTLEWTGTRKRVTLQGQSMEHTIIRLKPNCSGFQDESNRKAVIFTGEAPAQRFRNTIRDLTVSVGAGNPGAVGIQYMSNNQGHLRDVTIVSEDRLARIGLDMSFTQEVGPLLVKNLIVIGFDYGIKTGGLVNSQTFENITLRNQNKFAIYNYQQIITLHDVTSTNNVPVISNNWNGVVTLLEAHFTGTDGADNVNAIENWAYMYMRDVEGSGYKNLYYGTTPGTGGMPQGASINEFHSHAACTLFDSPPQSYGMQIRETPDIPWGNLDGWESPLDHGGTDASAIQAAIDAAGHTLYFNGDHDFSLDNNVVVRGEVRRIISLGKKVKGSGSFIVNDQGTRDTVIFDDIDAIYHDVSLQHTGDKTVVIRGCTALQYKSSPGAGDLFVEDYVNGALEIHQSQRAWFRQLDIEVDDTKFINRGGRVWIMGYKTEKGGTLCRTIEGGVTEIYGCFSYANGGDYTMPLFEVSDAAFSLAGYSGVCYDETNRWSSYIEATKNGITRSISESSSDACNYPVKEKLPVFTILSCYESKSITRKRVYPFTPTESNGYGLQVQRTNAMLVLTPLGTALPNSFAVFRTDGRQIMRIRTIEAPIRIPYSSFAPGIYLLRISIPTETRSRTIPFSVR